MTAAAVDATVPVLAVESRSSQGVARGLRDDDRLALEACRRGERGAFDGLVERYQRDVYRICFRYVNNHHDANDMAQEVFLRAYRALDRFRGDSAFSTWLYRIAVNTCLNFRAAKKPDADELPETLPAPGPGVLSRLEAEEKSRVVRAAVSKLPEKQRATLILKIYHELTHEQVADILGSTVGTVKANLFHALRNLKRELSARGEVSR